MPMIPRKRLCCVCKATPAIDEVAYVLRIDGEEMNLCRNCHNRGLLAAARNAAIQAIDDLEKAIAAADQIFRLGDFVMLKSGGPVMEIKVLGEEDYHGLRDGCVWQDANNCASCDWFYEHTLKHVMDEHGRSNAREPTPHMDVRESALAVSEAEIKSTSARPVCFCPNVLNGHLAGCAYAKR